MKIKKWRYIAIFTLQLLYPWEKGSLYPMDSKLGGNQSQPVLYIYINKIIEGCQFFSSSVIDENGKDNRCSSWIDRPREFVNFLAVRMRLNQSQFVSPLLHLPKSCESTVGIPAGYRLDI